MKVTFGLTEKNLEVIKKHLSYDGAEYSDHVWEIIGREIGWHPLTAALWYFKKLSQSENVQGSDTTGDERRGEAGNKPSLSAEEVLKKYTHSNILPYSEWLHKAMEEYKNQASNQTPVKECYVPVSAFRNCDAVIKTKNGALPLKKVTLPVTDWEKLEEKFYNEYTKNCTPQNIWNWIKSNIK